MRTLIPGLGTEAEREAAMDAEASRQQKIADESAERGRAYRAQFDERTESPRHADTIRQLSGDLNTAINDLMKFAKPGETVEQVADRGLASVRDPHLNQAANLAVSTAKTFQAELEGRQRVLERAAAGREDQRVTNMENARERDLVTLAKGIAQRNNISIGDALPLAILQAETDDPSRTLPTFSRAVAHSVADREDDPFVHNGGAA